jgi:hypothetical protein
MKHWHLGLIGVAAITAAWCNLAMADEKPAAMQMAPKDAPPPRLAAPMVMRPRPGAMQAAVAAPAPWNSFEFVFTGKLDEVKYGPVGMSYPPLYSVSLTFTVEKSIRGTLKAGDKVTLHHSARQQNKPTYPDGKICLVGAMTRDHGNRMLERIEEAIPETIRAAIDACELPLGWVNIDGLVTSPWAALGETVWPKAAGNLGATKTCAKTGRPALFCGEGIELAVKPLPPKKSIEWTNPDGDGDYEITVTNKTDKAMKVPALLTDGKDIQWANSLAILCQDKAYPAPGCKTGLATLAPVELQPGQSVTGKVNPLGLSGPAWPQGGYRISFQFCLGEKSVSHSFYYMSRHHDAIRDARQQANPPPVLKDGFISWDEMVAIIKANELQAVFQTHDRTVSIKTKDGKSYKATEPQIDLIFKVVKESGKPMPPMATE